MDDISNLIKLGKVGGVPGIALGGAVVVLGGVLGLTNAIPVEWRGPLLVVVVLSAVGFVLITLIGWIHLGRAGDQVARTEDENSAAFNDDASMARACCRLNGLAGLAFSSL